MKKPLYFDNHATTAVDPRVLEEMLPTFTGEFGNPESGHPYGWSAKLLVEKARARVAVLIGASDPNKEIIFTAGATESIHLAIHSQVADLSSRSPVVQLDRSFSTTKSEITGAATFGSADGTQSSSRTPHLITAATEHKAVLEAFAAAERAGAHITILPVDQFGRVTVEQVLAAITPDTKLVSLMHGNNEIGTLHPVREIGRALREKHPDVLFHVDAAQTVGKHVIDVNDMAIDLLSLSAHKFHGPKGVGALYLRHSVGRKIHLSPLFTGGGQERGLRSGTLNVPGIVGLGKACEIASDELNADNARLSGLRDHLIREVESALRDVRVNGHRTERLCNNISFTFKGAEADQLMFGLKDFAYSGGSACAGPTQSHVLAAIGASTQDPFEATIRIGLSRLTRSEDVSSLIPALIATVQNARELSGRYE